MSNTNPAPLAPQQQPLVQPGDVTYLGTLRLPAGIGNPNALAVDGDLMYVGTYFGVKPDNSNTAGVAVVRVPAGGLGAATLVAPPALVPNTIKCHRGGTYNDVIIGGILPRPGGLVVAGFTYYDGGGGQTRSHWAGPTPDKLAGPFTMEVSDVGKYSAGSESWFRSSMVGGYMGTIPPEWQALFGGAALTGQCCIPIIFRTSLGPCASVFDPSQVGAIEPIPSKMIVGYPYEHPTLGTFEDNPPKQFYGAADQLGSVAFPAGTRSVLFTGRHGDTKCYGPATDDPTLVGTVFGGDPLPRCFDPFDPMRGNHGAPYRPSMWAYDAAELLAVKQGAKKPWDVKPYARFDLPGLPLNQPYYLRAGWFDQATGRYYVGDNGSPVIHVFKIGVGAPPPPTPIDCIPGTVITSRVVATGECVNGSRTITEEFTRSGDVPAVNGGKPCTPNVWTATRTEACEDMPPPPPPTVIECIVTSSSQVYADKDEKLTVRCDTNGTIEIPKGTKFTITLPPK